MGSGSPSLVGASCGVAPPDEVLMRYGQLQSLPVCLLSMLLV